MKSCYRITTLPPSVNGMYAQTQHFNAKGRVSSLRIRSRAYDDWGVVAGLEVARQYPAKHAGTVDIIYLIKRRSGAQDVANLEKALTDLLVKQGVIKDDNRVESIMPVWVDDCDGVEVCVTDCSDRLYLLDNGQRFPVVHYPFGVSAAGKRFDKKSAQEAFGTSRRQS